MTATCSVIAWLCLTAQLPNMGEPRPESTPPVPTAGRPGVIIVVGGVGGIDVAGIAARWALPRAGVPHEVQHFVWTHGVGSILRDLQDTRHLLHKAGELAGLVRRLKTEAPARPVYLLGKSGGAGLVLAAAEELPPATLDRIILLSAAVAPHYDLRPALRATRREIIAFYSPFDQLVLGWGTSQFGTIDRVYGPSAGLRGFVVPAGLSADDRLLYERLVQVPWHYSMILQGHPGTHAGTSMPAFLAKAVAPWLKP